MGCIMFGPKRDHVTGEGRKLRDRNDFQSSPNNVWVNKSRRMRWRGMYTFGVVDKRIEGFGVKTRGKEATWKA